MQINFFKFLNFPLFKQVWVQSMGRNEVLTQNADAVAVCAVCCVWLPGCLPKTVFQELPKVLFLLGSTHLTTSHQSQAIRGQGASQLIPFATGSYQERVRLSFHWLRS